MELTRTLKEKLLKLDDTFIHRKEKFTVSSYGGYGNNSFVYWDGDQGTTIKMDYSMNELEKDRYKGVKKILNIEIY